LKSDNIPSIQNFTVKQSGFVVELDVAGISLILHHLSLSPDIEDASGTHFNNKAEPILSSTSLTEEVVAEHIAASEKLVNMALEGAT